MNYRNEYSNPTTNRMIYVKQDFMKEIQQNYQPGVLVNPHFIPVQPHFNKKFLTNNTIHINPLFQRKGKEPAVQQDVKILSESNKMILTNSRGLLDQTKKPTFVHEAPVGETSDYCNKFIKNVSNRTLQSCNSTNNLVVRTRTKLVRIPKKELPNNKRSSIHTKYKIIRTNVVKNAKKIESSARRSIDKKNRFKLDNRINQNLPKSKTAKNKANSIRYNFKTSFDFNSSLTYKKRLITKSKVEYNRAKLKMCKDKMLKISGQEYKLDSNNRTLTLIPKLSKLKLRSKCIRDVELKKRKAIFFNNSSFKFSSTGVQSIHRSSKKLKKSNIPCPLYRKFGKCKGKDRGTCIRIHNPDQINLCPKFLQGACVKDGCLLSHKVSAEKMPTCKYYLNGMCSKDDCPYLHVKINSKAEICKDFLEGFCKLAAECEKRHQYLCPDYEKHGKCMKQKCQYPHTNAINGFINPISSKFKSQSVKPKTHYKSCEIKNFNVDKKANETKKESKRYYRISSNSTDKVIDKIENKIEELSDSDDEDNNLPPTKRKTIGDLPSFIPF